VKKLLSVDEVAEQLGISVHTVYAWAGSGRIPVVKLGRRTLFDPDVIQHWISDCSRGGAGPQPTEPKDPPPSPRRLDSERDSFVEQAATARAEGSR